LTDPSYCQQIVTLTYPHIGSYGTNGEDIESDRVHAAGLIIKDLPMVASNFRSTQTLSAYLVSNATVAIANIDTRQLTRHLRVHGAQNGCILALKAGESLTNAIIEKAIAAAIEASKIRAVERAEKERLDELKKTARQEADDQRQRAYEERKRLREQSDRLKKDLVEVKAGVDKVTEEKKKHVEEEIFLKNYLKQAEANVGYYYNLLDKINAAEVARAEAARIAAAAAKKS
jgi:hypothetical protein